MRDFPYTPPEQSIDFINLNYEPLGEKFAGEIAQRRIAMKDSVNFRRVFVSVGFNSFFS
jgi:hypothetical protein